MKKIIAVVLLITSNIVLQAQILNLTVDWSYNEVNLKVGSIEKITWESDGVENIKIEYTTDAGKNWEVIEENYLAKDGFYNWIVPNTPSIYCKIKITDTKNDSIVSIEPYGNFTFTIYGKNLWTQVESEVDENLTHIKFIDEKNGVAWGNNILLSTKDNGISWNTKSKFEGSGSYFVGMEEGWRFVNHPDSSLILYTHDGGVSWKVIYKAKAILEGFAFSKIHSINFLNSSIGYFCDNYDGDYDDSFSIMKTIDGGKTWKTIVSDGGRLTKLDVIDEEYISYISYGCSGPYCSPSNFRFSIDGGNMWEYHNNFLNEEGARSRDISGWFTKKLNIVVEELQYTIGTYTNSVQIRQNYSKHDKFNCIYLTSNKGPKLFHFYNDNVGWFAGYQHKSENEDRWDLTKKDYNSIISRTLDGGETWELEYFESLENSSNINSLFTLDGKIVWAVGDNGTILKYEDKNVDNNISVKLSLESPIDDSVINLASSSFTEGQNYFINPITLGDPYKDLEKEANIFEGTRFSLDEGAIDENISLDIRLKLAGFDNTIPLPFFMFWGIEVAGEQSGVTSFEDFYKFNEGKKARICIPKTEPFMEVLRELEIDITEIDFAYLKGGEYITEGIDWEIKSGEEGKPDSVCIYIDHFSQIVGGKNLVTSVEEKTNNLPTKFGLEQNYPNPFNPTTTISYTIPSSVIASGAKQSSQISPSGRNDNIVTLKIFDVLGKEVKTLVNKQQNAGYYEVSFDASNLSSGIYYYQLKSGDFVETKKMILLK